MASSTQAVSHPKSILRIISSSCGQHSFSRFRGIPLSRCKTGRHFPLRQVRLLVPIVISFVLTRIDLLPHLSRACRDSKPRKSPPKEPVEAAGSSFASVAGDVAGLDGMENR